MPNLLQWVQYVPLVFEMARALRGKEEPGPSAEPSDLLDSFRDLKKDVTERLEAVEEESARLKSRLREAESTIMLLQVIVYLSGGITVLALILALIAIIRG